MRYNISFDKLVNDLTHYVIRDRWYILFVQSLLYPLQSLNDKFSQFAKDKHIEARMTSQVLYFEWFLNYKLNKHFINKTDKITISPPVTKGVPIYRSPINHTFVLWQQGENQEVSPVFYHKIEELKVDRYSFIVNCPAILPNSNNDFVFALKYWVDKYKIAGKTYLIKIES